jgi:hypothetical protein
MTGLRADTAVAATPRGGWTAAIIEAGHALEEALANPANLYAVADQLGELANTLGAVMITGASAQGHQLAGLVAARAARPLTLWAQNGAHGTMLVVEGMLVSGAQMARAAARAKAAGAERVVGAAVLAEPTGLASCRREIGDEITALRELRLA